MYIHKNRSIKKESKKPLCLEKKMWKRNNLQYNTYVLYDVKMVDWLLNFNHFLIYNLRDNTIKRLFVDIIYFIRGRCLFSCLVFYRAFAHCPLFL